MSYKVFMYLHITYIYLLNNWLCLRHYVISPIEYIYLLFIFPRRSVFALHRQCQNVGLGHDCVACIGFYVPLHGVGEFLMVSSLTSSTYLARDSRTSLR